MIKRFLIIFMAILMLASPLAVRADVVTGNEYRFKYANKTQRIERGNIFVANGPNGYVSAKKDPGSNEEVAVYKNGETVLVDQTYFHKGKYWGASLYHSAADRGWVLMEHISIPYLSSDFYNENEKEFYTYTGSYEDVYAAKRIVFWEWPGSDKEKRVIDYKNIVVNDIAAPYPYYSNIVYKDNEGREWGNIVVYYTYDYENGEIGTTNTVGWVCLSDPENSDIPAFNPAPKPTKWSPVLSAELPPKSPFNIPLLIISLVVILIVGAIVFIIIFRKRNKTGGKRND